MHALDSERRFEELFGQGEPNKLEEVARRIYGAGLPGQLDFVGLRCARCENTYSQDDLSVNQPSEATEHKATLTDAKDFCWYAQFSSLTLTITHTFHLCTHNPYVNDLR